MADTRNPDEPATRAPAAVAEATETRLLPDFCSAETLLRVLVLAILLSLVVLLLRDDMKDPLLAVAPIVLFIAWVALTSLMVLCLLQRWLTRQHLTWQALIPAAIPALNTALVHLAAEHFALVDGDGRLQVVLAAALLSLIAMHYFYLIAAWKQEMQAVAQAREQALRARVRPHFLFNSMNTIAGLCRTDPAKAEAITLHLADLFRATFATGASHPLAEELDLARSYLEIEQTRFGQRLQVEWQVPTDDPLAEPVPALILQPLVENAVQHGIAPARAGGRVWLRVQRTRDRITVEIGNTVGEHTGEGTHTAGADVGARLRQYYGHQAGIVRRSEPGRYTVRISLPVNATQNT